MKKLFVIVSCLLVGMMANGQEMLRTDELIPDQVKPALLYWEYQFPPKISIESIYPLDTGKGYWNVVHRDPVLDIKKNDFDYYLLDKMNIRPIVSHMYYKDIVNYKIEFKTKRAHISIEDSSTGNSKYKVKLPDYVAPEGPGMPVFLASLPLKENYHVKFYVLNRWASAPPKRGKLEIAELEVIGTERLLIDGSQHDTYKIEWTSESGAVSELWVLKDPPHYWVKVNHQSSPGGPIQSSHVTKFFIMN